MKDKYEDLDFDHPLRKWCYRPPRAPMKRAASQIRLGETRRKAQEALEDHELMTQIKEVWE